MEKEEPIIRKCFCCKKEIIMHSSSQKFCTSCSLFTRELRRQLSYAKQKSKGLAIRLYVVKDGAQRVRDNIGEVQE